MRNALILTIAVVAAANTARGADWLMMPSTYSHHPVTGQRVTQYRETPRPEAPAAPNFRSSGYTNFRSSLNYGQSADNYHRVDTWGGNVRPYGEWRFPYRPYSTPYPNWGPPFGGLNLGGFPGGGFFPGAGFGPGVGYQPGYRNRPGDRNRRPAETGGEADTGSSGTGATPDTDEARSGGRRRGSSWAPNPLVPYDVSPRGPARAPYPVPPHYDGYHPVYSR